MHIALALAALIALPAAAATPADVSKLSWMVGTWSQTKDQETTQETWRPPSGGVMSGVTETRSPGDPPISESMQISAEPAGVTFTAMPAGQPPTPFVLLPGKAGEAVFENKAHDFPQRVIYRRCDADLCARIEGTVEGQLQSMEWRYTRVK